MRMTTTILGSGLMTAMLGAGTTARAEQVRMSPAACSKIEEITMHNPDDGLPFTIKNTPVHEAWGDSKNMAEQVVKPARGTEKRSGFVCPIPDTETRPASDFIGVNIHLTDQNDRDAVRAYRYSKAWFGPGFEIKLVGNGTVNAPICDSDPVCTMVAPLFIEADTGNFHSLVVFLPTVQNNRRSELNGLFFF